VGAAGSDTCAATRTGRGAGEKLEAIRAAAKWDFPTADIDRMLEEIEKGYGSGVRP